jgi:hypothetical protein
VRANPGRETADLSTPLRCGRDDKFIAGFGFVFPARLETAVQYQTELSSRPERTRISCHAAPDTTTYAAFIKESRMNLASATNLNRKSGVAEWRDLRFSLPGSSV